MPFTKLNLSDLPILNDTNSSTSFDPPSKDFYLCLFQFKLSKIMSILSACTILPFDIALFYGIIWYERFGTDNRRTLMNKLLTSSSWTIIACLPSPPSLRRCSLHEPAFPSQRLFRSLAAEDHDKEHGSALLGRHSHYKIRSGVLAEKSFGGQRRILVSLHQQLDHWCQLLV